MKENSMLSKIAALLGIDAPVELATMKLMDGVVLEAAAFEADNEVFILTEDGQRIPLPVGEYEMEDGMMLTVLIEGIIAEVKEMPAKEEAPAVEEVAPEVEVEVEASEAPIATPKKTIKSVIEETLFSEISKLKEENETLKAQLSAITPSSVEPIVEEVEAAAKPISHNPEKQNVVQSTQYASKRRESTLDRIMNKLSNN